MSCEILGIIPARGGSKSIPGKNLYLCAGRPLICYSFDVAKESRCLTRTIVSTDSEDIAACAYDNGIEVPFMRPAEFAGDTTSMKAVVLHTIEALRALDGYDPDILVLLQPTSPLRKAIHVDEVVERLRETGADSVVSVSPVPSHYHPQWQLRMEEGVLATYMGDPMGSVATRRQNLDSTLFRDGAVYALWTRTVKTYDNLYGESSVGYMMSEEDSVNINEMMDLHLAELSLRQRQDCA